MLIELLRTKISIGFVTLYSHVLLEMGVLHFVMYRHDIVMIVLSS